MSEFDYHKKLIQGITQVAAAITNTRLYSLTHPQANKYMEKAYIDLTELLQRRPEITIMRIGGELVVDNRPINSGERSVAKFTHILRENGIGRVTLVKGLPKTDLQSFIQNLASPDGASVRTTPCIKLGKVELRIDKEGDPETGIPQSQSAEETIQALQSLGVTTLDELKELYRNVRRHKKIDVHGVGDMIKEFMIGFSRGINPMRILSPLKSKDEYTFTHAINVCVLTMSQAESLGFRKDHLYQIGIASVLHDTGKLFIPNEILTKPGALTQEERAIIETHTVKGARYILGLDEVPKLAVLGALEHHIKYDGTGYPRMQGEWRPNIVSQMIAISDVFDAMRSRRPYQEPKPQELILRVLKEEAGTSFNPQLVKNFMKLLRI